MIFKILTNVKGVLNAVKIYVPLADSIDADVTVVENSAPEGTMYVTSKNLGEHALLFSLAEDAALLYNIGVIELNVLMSESYNINDNHDKGDNEPEEKNSPELKCGKNALSSDDVRSAYIHFKSPFYTTDNRRNLLTIILYKNISELSITNIYFFNFTQIFI